MTYLLVSLLMLAQPEAGSDTWSGFLGGGANCTSAENLTLHWSPEEGIAWEVEIPGYGQSSPVVWGNRVFVTSTEGENKERCLIHAFDLNTGNKLWTQELEASQKIQFSSTVSKAAPTPVVDASGLYVFFESGDIAGFTHDGKPLWNRSLVEEFGEFQSGHGIGSSLAQTKDDIIVLIAHDGPSYLLAIDKSSGETHWKTDRESAVSWTSPIVTTLNGRSQVIVSSSGSVQAYNAADGTSLWTMEGISGNTVPSASLAGDRILIGARNGPRKGNAAPAAQSNCCLQLIEKDGQPGYEVVWKAEKATSSYATPLAHRGCAYFINSAGVVFCLDMDTGEQHYAKRIDGVCWASPLGAGDYIYFCTKEGITTIIKAGPMFEKVASNRLWGEAQATEGADEPSETDQSETVVYGVAAVDAGLIIRTGNKLYCVSGSPSLAQVP